MKRSFFLIILLLIGLNGCGDQKPPVFSGATFNLSGNVYEFDYLRNTSNRDKPIAAVNVLAAGSTTAFTQTASNGAFTLSNLPLGEYTISVSKEGYQKNGKLSNSTAYNFSSSSYAGTNQTVEYDLDPRPVFMGASVANNEEISATTQSFRLYFSEPMSRESVSAFLKMLALRSSSVVAKGIAMSILTWEADGKTAILTSSVTLQPDALYQLGLAASNNSAGIESIRDLQNQPIYGTKINDLSLYNSATDPQYGTYLYVPFKTLTDKTSVPTVPTNLTVRSSVTGSTDIDYNSVYASTSGVNISFVGSTGANGYKLYISADGTNYYFVKQFSTPSVFVSIADVVSALGSGIARGYDTYNYPIEPGLPWPFLGTQTIYFKLSGYNSLGESAFSSPLSVIDKVAPEVNATAVSESGTIKVIKFSEPLERSSAENTANYQFTVPPGVTISNAALINDYAYTYSPYKTTIVRLTLSGSDAGPRTVRINNLKDLTGNTIKANTDVSY